MGKNTRMPRGGDSQWEQSAEWHRFKIRAWEKLLPMMRDSAVIMSICPTDAKPDVKYALELGFSIMLDKPILVFADPSTEIPEHLRRVADRVVVADINTPEGREIATLATQEFLRDFGGAKENGDDD